MSQSFGMKKVMSICVNCRNKNVAPSIQTYSYQSFRLNPTMHCLSSPAGSPPACRGLEKSPLAL